MPENSTPAKLPLIAAAIISALAASAVFLPSLGFEFVNWDDPIYLSWNPDETDFGLKAAFTAVINGTWIPLTFLSYALDKALWGTEPFGYHLTNVTLHAANAFLLALLAGRLATGRLNGRGLFVFALAAGLLFGIHPLRAESVAWVTERKDVLNGLFFLLGVHAYVSYAKSKGAVAYVLTLVLFVLSLLSKPMTVTMPLVLLLLDYYPLDRLKRESWTKILLDKAPFLALGFVAGLAAIWAQGEAIVAVESLPFVERLHVAARGFLFYLYKTLLPFDLAPLYPRDFEAGLGLVFAVYVIALAALTALAIYLKRWSRAFPCAWACYIIMLLPVIGLLQVGGQAAADRYTYLPAMSLAMLTAAGFGWIAQRGAKAFAPVLTSLFLLSAILFALTLRQSAIWKNSVSLWSRQIEAFPAHYQGYVKRSEEYVRLGKSELAAADLKMISPQGSHGYMSRGNTYLSLGKFDLALEDFNKAIESGSHVPIDLYSNRGSALVNLGRFEEGISDLTTVIDADNGSSPGPYRARGTAYAVAGQYGNALKDFIRAAEIGPSDPSLHIDMGKVYMLLGDRESSYQSMKKALELGDETALRYLNELEGIGLGRE